VGSWLLLDRSCLLRSKLFFFFNHSFDSIVHILNKLSLTSPESSLV
jgi:hypothetical protein